MMPKLFNGKSVGTDGVMTASGWSNSEVFSTYMKTQFLKYVQGRNISNTILALYDGHRSHISLDLIEWAKNNNIVLFVLSPHWFHILQPLDVGCFGTFQLKYNQECLFFFRQTHKTVTRYDVCALAWKAYASALSPSNIQSAFLKSGIYSFQSGDEMIKKLKQKFLERNGEGDMELPNSLAQSNDEAMVKANEKQTDCSGDKRNDAAGHEAVDFLMQMGGEVQKKSWKSKEKKKYKSCYWRKSGDRRWHPWKNENLLEWIFQLKRLSKCTNKKPVTKPQQRKKVNLNENINTNLYNENQAGPSTYLPKVKPSDSTSITDSGETEEEMNEKEKWCVCKHFYV